MRDTSSNALLNVNNDALNSYKKDRENRLKVSKVIEEHEEIKEDLNSIKETLKLILEKLK